MIRTLFSVSLFCCSAFAYATDTGLLSNLEICGDFKVERNVYLEAPSISLEFCETNKCDVFATRSTDLDKFATFMDLYILYASGYSDLSKRIRIEKLFSFEPISYIYKRFKNGAPEIRFSKDCQLKKTEVKAISCTLHSMATDLQIEKFHVTYDLGKHVRMADLSWKEKSFRVEYIEFQFKKRSKLGLGN